MKQGPSIKGVLLAKLVDDVRALAGAVLRHRLVPSFTAESRGLDAGDLMDRVLAAVPV